MLWCHAPVKFNKDLPIGVAQNQLISPGRFLNQLVNIEQLQAFFCPGNTKGPEDLIAARGKQIRCLQNVPLLNQDVQIARGT